MMIYFVNFFNINKIWIAILITFIYVEISSIFLIINKL